MDNKNRIELLAPAGDKERAIFALEYGADAIYCGAKQFSLRARASNFDFNDLKYVCEYAHKLNKKVYLVTNIICHNVYLNQFDKFIKQIATLNLDGFICADPFIIDYLANNYPQFDIHISTQQSITNSKAALFWKQNANAKRVILAREMKLDEIKMLTENTKDLVDIEIFIHGAVCISYSGRCMMSNNFCMRDSNIGGCAQSCRWKYKIINSKNPINHFFTMSAKDMMYFDYLDDLLKMNICSLKIEGRMKTVNYLTSVIKTYRTYIDKFETLDDKLKTKLRKQLIDNANREIDDAFLIKADASKMIYHDESKKVEQNFVFNIVKKINDYEYEILIKNHYNKNQNLIISSNNQDDVILKVTSLYDLDKKAYVDVINVPMTKAIIKFNIATNFNEFSIGRIINE